jgi:hypothetical protein
MDTIPANEEVTDEEGCGRVGAGVVDESKPADDNEANKFDEDNDDEAEAEDVEVVVMEVVEVVDVFVVNDDGADDDDDNDDEEDDDDDNDNDDDDDDNEEEEEDEEEEAEMAAEAAEGVGFFMSTCVLRETALLESRLIGNKNKPAAAEVKDELIVFAAVEAVIVDSEVDEVQMLLVVAMGRRCCGNTLRWPACVTHLSVSVELLTFDDISCLKVR